MIFESDTTIPHSHILTHSHTHAQKRDADLVFSLLMLEGQILKMRKMRFGLCGEMGLLAAPTVYDYSTQPLLLSRSIFSLLCLAPCPGTLAPGDCNPSAPCRLASRWVGPGRQRQGTRGGNGPWPPSPWFLPNDGPCCQLQVSWALATPFPPCLSGLRGGKWLPNH